MYDLRLCAEHVAHLVTYGYRLFPQLRRSYLRSNPNVHTYCYQSRCLFLEGVDLDHLVSIIQPLNRVDWPKKAPTEGALI